jgi:hypothetical protein
MRKMTDSSPRRRWPVPRCTEQNAADESAERLTKATDDRRDDPKIPFDIASRVRAPDLVAPAWPTARRGVRETSPQLRRS